MKIMATFDQTFHGNKIYVDLTLICLVLENNFHLWINKQSNLARNRIYDITGPRTSIQ